MESTSSEADNKTTESPEQVKTESWYVRFIKGKLGFAWTFWYHGVLTNVGLKIVALVSFAIDHSGNLALLVAIGTAAYLCALLVAVWRAGRKYKGSQFWPFAAVACVIVAIVNWMEAILVFLMHAGS